MLLSLLLVKLTKTQLISVKYILIYIYIMFKMDRAKILGILLMWIYVDISTLIILFILINIYTMEFGLFSMIHEWKDSPI